MQSQALKLEFKNGQLSSGSKEALEFFKINYNHQTVNNKFVFDIAEQNNLMIYENHEDVFSEALEIEMNISKNAKVQWIHFQSNPENYVQDSEHQRSYKFDLKSGAHLNVYWFGIQLGKHQENVKVNLFDPQSSLNMTGFQALTAKSKYQLSTEIYHHAPQTKSHQLLKGIVNENSRSSFVGDIHVMPNTSGVEAKQYNHNILLSSEARVSSVPNLRIAHDDVSCAHGATTGYMDPEQLFYLRTRGLSEAQAKSYLLRAFYLTVVEGIENQNLKQIIDRRIQDFIQEDIFRDKRGSRV